MGTDPLTQNPFAVLTFNAARAILTSATNMLAMKAMDWRARPSSIRAVPRLLVGLAIATLAIAAHAAPDVRLERLLGPEIPTGDYKHPASFTELANGDLFVVFFSGRGEYHDNAAAVFGTRLKRGATKWSKPAPIARNPFHSLGNAVIWQAPDGIVWLFFVARYGETWSASRISAKISRDGAQSWSEPFQLTFEAGTMVRGRPIIAPGGDYLLPVYHEVGTDIEAVDKDCTSFFLRFDPAKQTWSESNRIHSRLGNIQPAPAVIAGERLVAFCRRGGDYNGRPDGWLVRSESTDGGRTWSEGRDSEFPNPNAAVDFLRLANGHHLLVFNSSFADRTPLTVALSTDGAKSFPHRRDLIARPDGDFAYPTALQTRDGLIHVLFTDRRKEIFQAVFAETAVPKAN